MREDVMLWFIAAAESRHEVDSVREVAAKPWERARPKCRIDEA
jgi:hypothetical protein